MWSTCRNTFFNATHGVYMSLFLLLPFSTSFFFFITNSDQLFMQDLPIICPWGIQLIPPFEVTHWGRVGLIHLWTKLMEINRNEWMLLCNYWAKPTMSIKLKWIYYFITLVKWSLANLRYNNQVFKINMGNDF